MAELKSQIVDMVNNMQNERLVNLLYHFVKHLTLDDDRKDDVQ